MNTQLKADAAERRCPVVAVFIAVYFIQLFCLRPILLLHSAGFNTLKWLFMFQTLRPGKPARAYHAHRYPTVGCYLSANFELRSRLFCHVYSGLHNQIRELAW